MTDVFPKEKRSEIMSKIRGKDTKIEVRVRSYLFKKGYRFRKNDKRYPGTPDIVLPKYKTAIFVNGCFWHGHENCKYYKLPKSNVKFWEEKVKANRKRDSLNIKKLEKMGFKALTLWECDLNNNFEEVMYDVVNSINSNQ